VLPASPILIPPTLIDGWEATYAPAVRSAVQGDPARAAQLIAAPGARVDTSSPPALATTTVSTTLGVLWYNVFATNVARERYGGNAYDNTARVYAGSVDDGSLNAGVQRFAADTQALAALGAEETSGRIRIPLVVVHTTGDPTVPFRQAERYLEKAEQAGLARNITLLRVERYGHCAFESSEVLEAFLILRQRAEERLRVYVPLAVRS
jgi:pimeloyl-ACP methyl ester carboxylesterase